MPKANYPEPPAAWQAEIWCQPLIPRRKLNCSENVNTWSECMWQELPTTTAPFKRCFWFASWTTILDHSHRGQFYSLLSGAPLSNFTSSLEKFFLYKHSMPEGGASLHPFRRKSFVLYFITDRYTYFYTLLYRVVDFVTVIVFLVNLFAKASAKKAIRGGCLALA